MQATVIDLSGNLFNAMQSLCDIKNDAALAIALQVRSPVISKIRHGKLRVGPTMIIKAHKVTGWPIEAIESLIAGKDSEAAK